MSPGRIKIRAGTVVSSNGSNLRGAPVWVYAWGKLSGKSDYAIDPAYYRKLKEAGLNSVRMVCFDPWQRTHGHLHWDLNVPGERAEFLAELDRAVNIATEQELNVMINYHDTGNYDPEYLATFWKWIAPRYASQENVFYELVNEPVEWSPSEYTDHTIDDLQQLYRQVREIAPETHLVLLSFARIQALDPGLPAARVASQLTDVDWSNASVGFHAYGCDSSKSIVDLKKEFPVLHTEVDIPAEAGGEDNSTPLDGETYGVQTMERLSISWFGWHIDGYEAFERCFIGGVLEDAKSKDYTWEAEQPQAARGTGESAIGRFFREFPVRRAARIMGMKRSHIGMFLSLSFAVALLDGIMIGMLLPVSYGLAEGSFAFMSHWPGIAWLHSYLPTLAQSYTSMFLALAAIMFLLGVSRGAFSYALHLLTANFYGAYSTQLASYLFGRYLSFGKTYFDQHNPGKLAAVIDHHHDLLNLFQGLLRGLTESMTLLAYLAVMLVISWRLTLVSLLVFPAVYLVRRWITTSIRKPSELANNDSLQIAGQIYRVLSAIPLYQSFSRETSALKSYQAMADQNRRANYRVWVYRGLIGPVQDISTLLALLVILSLAFVVEDGSTKQIAAMFVFFFVARLALPRLGAFHEIELEFEEKLPSVRLLFDVFNDKDKYKVPAGDVTLAGLKEGIEFRKLSFAYPATIQVLHGVSFPVEKGRMTALVGPSGAGKTTLTNLLMRFYDVAPGQLFIDGTDIRDFTLESLRKQIALVNQDVVLLSDTLRKNLLFGLDEEVSDVVLNQALKDAGLQDMLDILPGGLDTELGDRGLTLSGGQRQRVAIARALLRQAPILILDEATSSLDSRTERQVQIAIEHAVQGCTSLVIAHRLSTIQRADRIVVLDRGQVVEQGSLHDLLERKGLFHAMWEAQKFN